MIQITDPKNYQLLKTGQLTQYGGYPDDGFYEMGVAKRYIIHTLLQYSGHTHIILNAKDNPHDNNCVYDTRTKLMWSRFIAAIVGPADDGKLPWTTNVNGEGFFTYCAAANAALLAGYGDWRIATIYELVSLVDLEAPSSEPDVIAFPLWIAAIGSATTAPDTITDAVYLSFASFSADRFDKTLNRWFALVRGG